MQEQEKLHSSGDEFCQDEHPPPPAPVPSPALLMGPRRFNHGLTQLPAGIGMEAQPGFIFGVTPERFSAIP